MRQYAMNKLMDKLIDVNRDQDVNKLIEVPIKMPNSENVVLVDNQDREIGIEEKMRAHELGLLHRAFSVFIYRYQDNTQNNTRENTVEFLLQKRKLTKYHCGGLWTNTCCSHPRQQESVLAAGSRRLKEEMSLNTPLRAVGSFIYRASFDNGLTEHEFDYVLIGEYNGIDPIHINSQEVEEYRWMNLFTLEQDLINRPALYTPWLKPGLQIALEGL